MMSTCSGVRFLLQTALRMGLRCLDCIYTCLAVVWYTHLLSAQARRRQAAEELPPTVSELAKHHIHACARTHVRVFGRFHVEVHDSRMDMARVAVCPTRSWGISRCERTWSVLQDLAEHLPQSAAVTGCRHFYQVFDLREYTART